MKSSERPKPERLRSAAVVKVKYLLQAGRLDDGFKMIFLGVLNDLELQEEEVEAYIEEKRAELEEICLRPPEGSQTSSASKKKN